MMFLEVLLVVSIAIGVAHRSGLQWGGGGGATLLSTYPDV